MLLAMNTSLVIIFLFSLFLSVAIGLSTPRLNDAQQCRLNRITGSQPSRRMVSEGGIVEYWDEKEEQFQCAGVAPTRIILLPNSLHMPSFHPSPRLAYVVQGKGLLGVVLPGCAETFTSQRRQEQEQEQEQRIQRIREGDVIAIPAGATHWLINEDDKQEFVVVSINDLNHLSNQLDQRHREFYLAGQAASSRENMKNILQEFNTQMLSEAFNVPLEIVMQMQREDERGICVKLQDRIRSMVRPGEGEEEAERRGSQKEEGWEKMGSWDEPDNSLEETMCSMEFHFNIDQQRQVDIHSRQAGEISMVDKYKLPILKHMDLSLEKANLNPNAMMSPHWSANSHSIMYVLKGDAQMQVVNYEGMNIMNDKVNQGEMVVVPQQFAATIRAGNNGVQFVTMKTSGVAMRNTLAGYTSVMKAMPLEVVRESYQMSPDQAEQIKNNRRSESLLLSPTRRASQERQD